MQLPSTLPPENLADWLEWILPTEQTWDILTNTKEVLDDETLAWLERVERAAIYLEQMKRAKVLLTDEAADGFDNQQKI